MARSLAAAGTQPVGAFDHPVSGTHFESRNTASGLVQSFSRAHETEQLPVQFAIGSGNHAVGFLSQVGNHLFQSPISYYTARGAWDMAPGYEQDRSPDFSRPVTIECLTCHAGKPQPLTNSLNMYQSPPFTELAIGCDRCHGSGVVHSRNPVRGSILNPAKLPQAERDSICEQCHLAGEIRIPNPGKSLADFQPGKRLEEIYTVYVAKQTPQNEIKVVSHSEQLAQSLCARQSAGKLWCGTCHNPHEEPARPVAYFRQKCLTCHARSLTAEHAAPDRDCIGCHMPKKPAKDGGHTAFTDHRITRLPKPEGATITSSDLIAWREPAVALRDRNLALALVTAGLQDGRTNQVIQGYRMLNRMENSLTSDAAALTVLGNVLLTAKQPAEARQKFLQALALRPDYAPYEVNVAGALAAEGDLAGAVRHAERATALDPLLAQAIRLLATVYREQGRTEKADVLERTYRASMGIK